MLTNQPSIHPSFHLPIHPLQESERAELLVEIAALELKLNGLRERDKALSDAIEEENNHIRDAEDGELL